MVYQGTRRWRFLFVFGIAVFSLQFQASGFGCWVLFSLEFQVKGFWCWVWGPRAAVTLNIYCLRSRALEGCVEDLQGSEAFRAYGLEFRV